ncbi:hypothetical protein ACSQ6I_07000 [Anabaena sp. WFMT]|uniref:hypothetical protein n=1 Tax=Anabaena sp. WFMT TaxID=3449730 RepID=UPI003F2220F9
MTSRADEIHKLIADIDNLLSNSGNRLSKLLSGQGQEDKDVLQRVRDFLVKLDESEESEESSAPNQSETPPLSSLLTRFVEQEQNQSASHSFQSQQEQSNFTAGQFKDEISFLLQPLQAELSGLLEERATLVKEIRQLEQKRLQNYSLTQQLANQEQIISEFLQVLISRLVPNLLPHLTRTLPTSPGLLTGEQKQEALNSAMQPVLGSGEETDRLATLARELDQRLLSLDGTVNVVFGSLERNITTYHQSLSQALAKMHSQGIQGEQLMANFLNNLTQHLQQQSPDAQSFLFGVDTQTVLSSPSLDIQPASYSAEELIQDIAVETEESPAEENLDRVLSELIADDLPASVTATFNVPNELQPEGAVEEELIQDIAVETEESPAEENLDRVLSELIADDLPASVTATFNVPNELQPEGAVEEELIQDIAVETEESPAEENLDRVLSELIADDLPASVTATFNVPDELQPESAVEEELIQDIAAETEESPAEENLDRVLSELIADDLPASVTATFNVPNELQPEGADDVDQLYASLFGGEETPKPTDAIILPMVTTGEVSTSETDSPLASEFADSISLSPIIQEQQEDELVLPEDEISTSEIDSLLESEFVDSISPSPIIQEQQEEELVLSDPVEQQDLNLLSESSGTVVEPTEQLSELWGESLLAEETQPQVEFASISKALESQPDSSDTITVLTDLLVDASSDEQLPSIDAPETIVEETPIISSAGEDKDLVATYISASPQENLLYLENTETEGVPDIVLDAVQLQQLDQDLANFNWQLNSDSEQTTNSESLQNSFSESLQNSLDDSQYLLSTGWPIAESPGSEATENIPIVAVSNLAIPQAELDLSQNTEKKKEGTISEPKDALFVSDILSDDSQASINDLEAVWYLGIDLGTTGISAALLNHSRLVVYPIYWSAETQLGETAFEQSFRLPAEVYLPTASIPHSEAESAETGVAQAQISDHVAQNSTGSRSTSELQQHLYSAHLKPYLHVAIPYKNTQQKWEPVLQLNEFSAGPLIWVVRSLSKLLLTLKSAQASTTPALIAHAVGIDTETFADIINKVTGIICTCPSSWSEQYRFNVREAILTSKLVSHPQQIFFVEEAIASLLPELDSANNLKSVQLNENQGLRPLKTSENPMQGNTLALNIGATATEMALVDLPTDLSQLTYRDFMLHSFAYAGKAIEQDIICQLLLPPKSRQPRGQIQVDGNTSTGHPSLREIPGLDQIQWSSLSWEGLELPRVGEPDISARIRFQQRLESSLLGQALLDTALSLKLILQHQESFTLELADQCWILQRRDLESQVFVPYVRRLNRELNKLLVARGIPTEAINQAILSGGVASIGTVNRWLRQKLPNAKITQDLYLGENGAPNCSRVAYGLATLPLHPQVLEIPRQQYTDYFLFAELLRLLPDSVPEASAIRSLSFGEILQLFESRGINTRICQQRLLAFLEGELPAGIIPFIKKEDASDVSPTPLNSLWLTKSSQENPDYQAIASAPLFEKQGNLSYRPNSQQLLFLRRYLDAIKASTLQSLDEPHTVNFSLLRNPVH